MICNNWNITFPLTHWGRVTHTCVSKLTIIVSDNGLSPGRRQAIIWTNAGLLLIRPLGTNFNEILIEILTFSFMKMRLKVSSAKWRPFCLGLNVLRSEYLLLEERLGRWGVIFNLKQNVLDILAVPIIVENSVEAVSDGQHCGLLEDTSDRRLDEFVSLQVNSGRRFVQDEDLWPSQEGPGQAYQLTLTHAARVRTWA